MQLSLLIRGIVGLASVGAISSWLGLVPGVELGSASFHNLVAEENSGSIETGPSEIASGHNAEGAAGTRVVKFQASGSFSDVPPLPGGSSSRSSLSDIGGPSVAGGIQLPVLPDAGDTSNGSLLPPPNSSTGVVPRDFPAAPDLGPSVGSPGAAAISSRQSTLPPPSNTGFGSQPAGLPQSPPTGQLAPRSDFPPATSSQPNPMPPSNSLRTRDTYPPSSNNARGVSNYDAAQQQLQQGTPRNQRALGGNRGLGQQSGSFAGSTPANTVGFNKEIRTQAQSASERQIRTQSNNANGLSGSNTRRGVGEQGFYDPRTFASGPPFVSPPPRGRYPTSRYNHGLFQNAAYQRTVAQNLQANANANRNGLGQLASTQAPLTGTQIPATSVQPQSNTANLPQYAPVNAYPTAAYQCNPNIGAPTLPPPNNVPGTSIPPTLPPNLAPNLYSANNNGYAPLLSLGQEGYNVQLGRGILGQPTVYVPGQPVRNFLRYLSP